MGTAAYVALLAQEEEAVQKLQNKRHGEPALTNSYSKQTKKQTKNRPPPNLCYSSQAKSNYQNAKSLFK